MYNLVSRVATLWKRPWRHSKRQSKHLLSLWLSSCLTYQLQMIQFPITSFSPFCLAWASHGNEFPNLNLTYLASPSWWNN